MNLRVLTPKKQVQSQNKVLGIFDFWVRRHMPPCDIFHTWEYLEKSLQKAKTQGIQTILDIQMAPVLYVDGKPTPYQKAAYLKFDSELLETINALREIVKKIVVFSGSNYGSVVDGLNVLFNDMGTLKMIDRIVTSDLLQETTKPDLTAYQQMLKKCSINPKTAMMVDDSPAEIASAKKAGMKGVLVGNHPESVLKKIKPDLQIPNIYSLISILAGN